MKPLLIIKDSDIFDNPTPEPTIYKERIAVKMIVLDNNNRVAVFGRTARLLPGGGVEHGESKEDAVRRESLEEIGCPVEIIDYLGVTEEYRAKIKRKQFTHFYVAKVIGDKGIPCTTQEDEQGIKVEWLSKESVLSLLRRQKEETPKSNPYNTSFNIRTQLFMFERYVAMSVK